MMASRPAERWRRTSSRHGALARRCHHRHTHVAIASRPAARGDLAGRAGAWRPPCAGRGRPEMAQMMTAARAAPPASAARTTHAPCRSDGRRRLADTPDLHVWWTAGTAVLFPPCAFLAALDRSVRRRLRERRLPTPGAELDRSAVTIAAAGPKEAVVCPRCGGGALARAACVLVGGAPPSGCSRCGRASP